MSRILYGSTLVVEQSDVFIVQALWPSKTKSLDKTFGSYSASAFDDIDQPSPHSDSYGTFDKKNADVAKHKSRVYSPSDSSPRFTDPKAALAYAERLQERGQLTSAQGVEPWRKDYLGKIFTRVIRETVQKNVTIIDGVDD